VRATRLELGALAVGQFDQMVEIDVGQPMAQVG
jgi:hypothetical protein